MTNPFCFDELLLAHFFFSTHTQYIFGLFFKKRKNIEKKFFVLWQSAHCHHQFIISERERVLRRTKKPLLLYIEKKKWFKQIEIGRSGRRKTWIMSDYIFIHLPHGVDLRLGRRVAHRLTGKERAFSFFESSSSKLKKNQNLKKMTMPEKRNCLIYVGNCIPILNNRIVFTGQLGLGFIP